MLIKVPAVARNKELENSLTNLDGKFLRGMDFCAAGGHVAIRGLSAIKLATIGALRSTIQSTG